MPGGQFTARMSDGYLPSPEIRRRRAVRLVDHAGQMKVYPEPHDAPVLPAGWAPLDRDDQEAVLNACDEHPSACRLRLGSPWDPSTEYRVYALDTATWQGVCVATIHTAGATGLTRNARLLAIATDPRDAVHVAVDFLNWDLEAEGASWRLSVLPTGV